MAPFYVDWMSGVPSGSKYHQAGVCQAYVLGLYDRVTHSGNRSPKADEMEGEFERWLKSEMKPLVDAGTGIILSTRWTSGHVVT